MHIRMDRMKTLRWLLVSACFIYMMERGIDKIDHLVTHTIDKSTQMIVTLAATSAQDREDAESFQRSLDRHNKVATFVWKRPKGRNLSERTDEFSAKEIAYFKKIEQSNADKK